MSDQDSPQTSHESGAGPRQLATETDLFLLLDQLGIHHETQRHAPVFTVEESAALLDRLPGGHIKNLFLKDKKGQSLLVVVEAQRRVDIKSLGQIPDLGIGRLSFASPETLLARLGVTPGSVTPFAVINAQGDDALTVIVDAGLMRHDRLNAHPLHNAATTAVAKDDLIRFLHHCGFPPIVVDFDAL